MESLSINSLSLRMPIWQTFDSIDATQVVPADVEFDGCVIYEARCKVTHKRYFGETVNFKDRFRKHKNQEKKKKADPSFEDSYFYNFMRKYGFCRFDWFFYKKIRFKGLDVLTKKQRRNFFKDVKANFLHPGEKFYIQKYKTTDRSKGFNMKESGKGGAGHVFTNEQRARMSISAFDSNHRIQVISCKILEDMGAKQKVILKKYASIRVAAETTGVNSSQISKCCRKKAKSIGGCIWWKATKEEIEKKVSWKT